MTSAIQNFMIDLKKIQRFLKGIPGKPTADV
jgi:hypothetical protein